MEDLSDMVQSLVRKAMADRGGQQAPASGDSGEHSGVAKSGLVTCQLSLGAPHPQR